MKKKSDFCSPGSFGFFKLFFELFGGIEPETFGLQSKATSLTKWPSSQLILELKTSISII
jgi:hypothetical protein